MRQAGVSANASTSGATSTVRAAENAAWIPSRPASTASCAERAAVVNASGLVGDCASVRRAWTTLRRTCSNPSRTVAAICLPPFTSGRPASRSWSSRIFVRRWAVVSSFVSFFFASAADFGGDCAVFSLAALMRFTHVLIALHTDFDHAAGGAALASDAVANEPIISTRTSSALVAVMRARRTVTTPNASEPPPRHRHSAERCSDARTRFDSGDPDGRRLGAVPRSLARLLATCIAAGALVGLAAVPGSAQDASEGVSIESLTPASGPPGTEIAYTLAGTDEVGARECAQSSAYRLELLAADGTLLTTGGETVAVPDGAAPGEAFVRLVCYLPDATGRRVIHGLCASFTITEGSEAATESGFAIDCPPTPRVTFGQAVIGVERAISQAFNPMLYFPFTS